mmetsp:Transcript_50569/g.156491  ORF Transcript_50569/g.156491 Transcript_50569/m.156491 type:complete len:211 (-) Transcript_50569:449-1081(-)
MSLLPMKDFVLLMGSWKKPRISASSVRSSCRQAAAPVMAAQRVQPQKGHGQPPLLKETIAAMPFTTMYPMRLATASCLLLAPPKPMNTNASKALPRPPATAPRPRRPTSMMELVAQSRCGLGKMPGGTFPVTAHTRLKAQQKPVATKKPPTNGASVFRKMWRQTVKTKPPNTAPVEYQSTARPCTVWSPARARPPQPCAPRRPREIPNST